jgi:hypothetical protein
MLCDFLNDAELVRGDLVRVDNAGVIMAVVDVKDEEAATIWYVGGKPRAASFPKERLIKVSLFN